ncbi:MAG: DUF4233 domain-containing protein [Streptosporangiales bacterium]|nr:DUF4233 domain-containing protein [Streptosporangiales bacterium]
MEALVVALAVPVAARVADADLGLAVGGAAGLVLGAVAITALLRYRWAYVAGTVWQALVIATGVVVPAMYVLGAAFACLWGTALWLGRKHEPRRVPRS